MTEQQLLRQAKRRLAILQHAEEVTGNVSRTCRYYGISRQCFYTWQRRYEEHGLDGLRDRSSRPHFSPLATHTDIVGKIVYLRQHYHFGPRKISMYLARYHDITDCTRLRVLRIYPKNNQATAIQFLDHVLEKLPFQVEQVQTDNGAEFQSTFHWHVLDRGIRHVYIKPHTPRLNGKVERSHRIDNEEFYRMLEHGVIIDDAKVFNDKLQEWEDFYNFHRPHGGLDGQTPYERLRQKTTGT